MGSFSSKRSSKVLVIGLDNSGKSTIINHLKPEKQRVNEQYATVGFVVEQFKYASVNFTMFDMSGAGRYRNLWEHYYSEAQGIIFVIDSSDTVRLCVVKDELETLLQHKDISSRPIPILFFANKLDMPRALTPSQISESLELASVIPTDKQWNIVASNALSGQGLEEGVKWLTQHLQLTNK